MGWSAEYRLPERRIEAERLRALLEQRLSKLQNASLAYFGAGPDDYLAAGIAFTAKSGRAYQGCIEWWFDQPASELDVRTTKASEIYDRLEDEEMEEWVPRRFKAFAAATSSAASIIGDGRGCLEVGGTWARVSLVLPESVVSEDAFREEMAALSAIVRDGDVEWACGYPGLLLRRRGGEEMWSHVPVALPEGVSITHVLPRTSDERWLLADVGGVWRMRGDTLERIEGVPDSDDYPGGTDPIWSMVTRGDEVWIANGCASVFCISKGVARSVPVSDGVERIVVGPDDRLWLATRDALWTGDGARFERALGFPAEERPINVLLARPRGVIAVSATRITTIGATVEAHTLAEAAQVRAGALATDDEAVLWLARGDHRPAVLRVDLPRPPSTRMTVRSNRDDNREDECWYAITALASEICATLGGVDVQS